MRKVLYVLNDCMRKFSYPRIAGIQRAIENAEESINLYVARSDGFSGFSPSHNQGEYNIFRLPDYSEFDGIFLDVNSAFSGVSNTYGERGANYAVRAAAASGKPVITMANYIEGFYYVGIDNHEAMTSVIRHLHQVMGLTDFWFAMGPVDNYENIVRTQAMVDYCRENGLACDEERFYAESYIMECGTHAFERFYRHFGGRLPQAVICANDRIAAGICRAAEAVGLQVPRDFLVTGFDDLDTSAFLSPSITTVDQMSWSMGQVCVDTLCRIWRGEDVPQVIHTPTKLVLRESTGHPDPGQKELKKQVTEFIMYDTIMTEFSYKLSAMQYQLPGCESVEDICRALAQCVANIECKGVRLVLDRVLFEDDGFDGDRGRAASADDRLLADGYSDTMELVFAWQAGGEPEFPHALVGRTLDLDGMKGPAENYMLVPLHFLERTVGYLVIWDCVSLVRIKCVSALVNTLTMALRSFFANKRLSSVNRVLSGISMRDDLTGLYNRLGYHNLGHRLFREVHGAGKRLGILFIDMDWLKYINDTYGHAGGDQAILSVSNAIRRGAPEGAVAVRYGGDEFLVLTPAERDGDVQRVMDAIARAIPEEAGAMELPEVPGVSAGYVLTDPAATRSLDEYVEEADGLMYLKKRERHGERG